eukprot:10557899-Karenia_brevis.AAC.1
MDVNASSFGAGFTSLKFLREVPSFLVASVQAGDSPFSRLVRMCCDHGLQGVRPLCDADVTQGLFPLPVNLYEQ